MIGLLTLNSRSYNYGGLLQEYALQETIIELGDKCEVIDYNLISEEATFSYRRNIRYLTLNKVFKKAVGMLHREEQQTLVSEIIIKRHAKFDKFRKEHMDLSPRCSYRELSDFSRRYKKIVCGSDQIWNPSYNRPSYFLNFIEDKNKKIIYAASIGVQELTNQEAKVYREYIKELKYISVREEKAKKIVKSLVDNVDIEIVLDPTLLLDSSKWKALASDDRLIDEKYIFVYFLDLNAEKKSAAVEFANITNLKIMSIPYLLEKNNPLDDCFSDFDLNVGPIEFLNLILHAEYVITDSFHATVFSILFNKHVRVFTRRSGKTNMNSRIETLLGYVGREDCLIESIDLVKDENLEIISTAPDYDMNILKMNKMQSINWLKTALQA